MPKILIPIQCKTNNKMTLLYLVEGNKEQINRVPKKLYENEWFESCKIE